MLSSQANASRYANRTHSAIKSKHFEALRVHADAFTTTVDGFNYWLEVQVLSFEVEYADIS